MTPEMDGSYVLEFEPSDHVYRVNGIVIPSTTQILDNAGLSPDYSIIQPRVLKHARERGLHVDLACDLFDEDDLDWSSVSGEAVGYVSAWARFRADHDYRPHASQIPLYHPEYNYAGTLDSVGQLAGQWVVVERKSTARMYDTYGLQLGAYAMPGLWSAPPGGGVLAP